MNPKDKVYPSGFCFGDRIEIIKGSWKYNSQMKDLLGSKGTVIEPPNFEDWPEDAVQVNMGEMGFGAIDADQLRKINFSDPFPKCEQCQNSKHKPKIFLQGYSGDRGGPLIPDNDFIKKYFCNSHCFKTWIENNCIVHEKELKPIPKK